MTHSEWKVDVHGLSHSAIWGASLGGASLIVDDLAGFGVKWASSILIALSVTTAHALWNRYVIRKIIASSMRPPPPPKDES